ncbi:MAG: hypothetical protein ACI8UZ_002649 [Akkermansiaceae bacterium]|jgi:hypothetical protein
MTVLQRIEKGEGARTDPGVILAEKSCRKKLPATHLNLTRGKSCQPPILT